MAARALRYAPAFLLLSFCSTVFSQDFPDIKKIDYEYYQTEVQITDVLEEISAYATEYHSTLDKQGALKLYFQGDQQMVFYDNISITEIRGNNCTAWDVDISEFNYKPIYYGWLNQNPITIGPSAALWYAQTRKKEDFIKAPKQEDVRSIKCDKWTLPVKNDKEDLIYEYYFAPANWTTPYSYKKLLVPIRIKIVGNSSMYAADGKVALVEQINDFAYFKPLIDDSSNLLPPIGLGCKLRQKTDYMPDVPKAFMYSAEVVDLLGAKKQADVEIQFQKTWYDYDRLMARRDIYSRKNGYRSRLYDFNTGTLYRTVDDGTCVMAGLKNTDFQTDPPKGVTSSIKTPKQALNLDGEFYEMGTRSIRGLKCDTFESVQFNKTFKGKNYYKLVVTAYFTESKTKVGVKGEMESRIPIYYIITGYDTPDNKTLQLQYNIFEFDDVVWPEMHTSFRLDRCYAKADSKAYFVLVIPIGSADAAKMEELDDLIIAKLKTAIARNARVPEMRIPYLKADYKPTGVYVTGLMLERPPALIQFSGEFTGPTVTTDSFIKAVVEAETTEECAYACVDEKDFPCKAFYFCGRACFLKSTDLGEEGSGKSRDLGECTEYTRDDRDSTNFRQSYLVDAMGYLDQSILDGNVTIAFPVPSGEEIVTVADLIVGDGPYIGDDAGDQAFSVNVEWRKLDSSLDTVREMEYVGSLHDCYKRCKEEGSECASFSYCPNSKKDNKECMISSELVVKGFTKDTELIPDNNCNIYNLKYVDYFIPYPEKVTFLKGERVLSRVDSLDKCAASCRMEQNFTCRGFEYCKARKQCSLHTKHILDLKPGEKEIPKTRECVHYAARYIMDYMDMGTTLLDDKSNVRYGTSLEECARICSEDLKEDCKSFNYCQRDDSTGADTTCELSKKLLRDDGVTISDNEKRSCMHYEKRDSVHEWSNKKAPTLGSGYTKKGFAGLVVGMIALGIIVGALGFVFYSYMRARGSGEGMAVRFMKNDA